MASELTVGGITASGNISTTAGILSISGPTASGTVATIFGSTGFGFSFIADAVAGPFDNIISTGTGEVISLGVAGVPYATVSPTGLAVTGAVTVSGGIQFPATQSASADANTLDDYEEGSWTPVIGGGTCTNLNGKYTKVGRQVTVTVEVANGVLSGASGYIITGLPFPNGSTRSGTGTVASYSLMDNANPVGILVATTTQIDFVYNNASSNWSVANFVNTTGWLHFSATYFV